MLYRTDTWEQVVSSFSHSELEVMRPMGDLVRRVAVSRYAAGLHPVRSMFDLVLFQTEEYNVLDGQIRVRYDAEAGEFVIQYHAGPFEKPFTTHPLEST